MTDVGMVLLPVKTARDIRRAIGDHGRLSLAVDRAHGVAGACGSSVGDAPRVFEKPRIAFAGHPLGVADQFEEAVWFVAAPRLHVAYGRALTRRETLPRRDFPDDLREAAARNDSRWVVTYSPGVGLDWAAWHLGDDGVRPVRIDVLEPSTTDPQEVLDGHWQRGELSRTTALVVGAGSIGSAAAEALARYGAGRLILVDPDRLRWRNLARHQGTWKDIGLHKVDAVGQAIEARWPATRVEPRPWDVIHDANAVRDLVHDADVVICATDGVEPRRVVSHLCRRARRTAILACVLADGAVGEVLRLRPWMHHGCLLCQRADLVTRGVMDPEPGLDTEYGAGGGARPMTAVGSDLALVGQFAAQLAVSTVLESAGYEERLVTRDYALVGLRHERTLPPPFDLRTGCVTWQEATPPRPGCPTCEAG
jgi:hypothetical protein